MFQRDSGEVQRKPGGERRICLVRCHQPGRRLLIFTRAACFKYSRRGHFHFRALPAGEKYHRRKLSASATAKNKPKRDRVSSSYRQLFLLLPPPPPCVSTFAQQQTFEKPDTLLIARNWILRLKGWVTQGRCSAIEFILISVRGFCK